MERSWYHIAKECTALRKNVLRVDLCIFIDKEEAFSNEDYLNSTIKSILTSAIINGLDVVGILSPDTPNVGLRAQQMAVQQQMDIVVVPGQTYICIGKEELYIYKLTKPVPKNLSIDKACGFVHDNNGFVLATNVNSKLELKFSMQKLVHTEILTLISQDLSTLEQLQQMIWKTTMYLP